MYLGWKVRERISREYRGFADNRNFAFGNKAAIWSAIDLETSDIDGEKLNDALDEVGIDSEQLTAQHKRAACAEGVLSLLLALSQHFIMCPLAACSGVPANTPEAKAKSRKSNVSLFTISLNI